jgi:hypothetical protein
VKFEQVLSAVVADETSLAQRLSSAPSECLGSHFDGLCITRQSGQIESGRIHIHSLQIGHAS